MWQQTDSNVVRADVLRLSDSRSSSAVLGEGGGEVIDEHYSLSVVHVGSSGVLGTSCRWREKRKHFRLLLGLNQIKGISTFQVSSYYNATQIQRIFIK